MCAGYLALHQSVRPSVTDSFCLVEMSSTVTCQSTSPLRDVVTTTTVVIGDSSSSSSSTAQVTSITQTSSQPVQVVTAFGTTPGGTFFGTTPGGMRSIAISKKIYTRRLRRCHCAPRSLIKSSRRVQTCAKANLV